MNTPISILLANYFKENMLYVLPIVSFLSVIYTQTGTKEQNIQLSNEILSDSIVR